MKTLVLILVLTLIVGTKANYQQSDGCTEANCLNANEYCQFCETNRQGRSLYAHPNDNSKYVQCYDNGERGIIRSCSPCLIFLEEQQGCDTIATAKNVLEEGTQFKLRLPYEDNCRKYYECSEDPLAEPRIVKCCDGENNKFNAEWMACEKDGSCNDDCQDSTPGSTTKSVCGNPIIGNTCFSLGHVYDEDDTYSNQYWLTWNGCRHIKYTCPGGADFDLGSCACAKVDVEQGCGVSPWLNIDFNGAPIKDSSKNSYWIDTGDVKVKDDQFGEFTGTSKKSNLQIPYFINQYFGSDITLSVRFNSHATDDDDKMGILSNGDCNEEASIYISSNGDEVEAGIRTIDDNGQHSAVADAKRNVMNHVVLTYDGKSVKVYVNGDLINTREASSAVKRTLAAFSIGRGVCENGETRLFKGLIDDVQIMKCAMSDAEVTTLYQKLSKVDTSDK